MASAFVTALNCSTVIKQGGSTLFHYAQGFLSRRSVSAAFPQHHTSALLLSFTCSERKRSTRLGEVTTNLVPSEIETHRKENTTAGTVELCGAIVDPA